MTNSASLETTDIRVANMKCQNCIERVRRALKDLPGVENVEPRMGSVRVVYLPQLTRPQELHAALTRVGYPPAVAPSRRKGFISRWIDRLAESNEKNFGTQGLDCCSLNHKETGEQ